MYLYINTSSPEKIILALINKKGEVLKLKNIKAEYQQSEKLLNEIDKIFAGTGLDLPDIKGILAVKGPGSFTALRIGIATANTLAWSLNIPILGIENKNNQTDKILIDKNYKKILNKTKFTKQTLPKYGKEPNITIKKSA
ncbi:tRNA (adenosine(37)-N6)-threonylcarbamoyltransferase complex dimerization subunit type 1 TsaB [Patescibacteria group bacterium]